MTRLGYQIPNFSYPGVESAGLFAVIARQAAEADASGFDTVMVMDHFYQLPWLGRPDQEMLECYALLSALAQHTTRVRLSALVSGNTYRNPTLLAKVITTLDVVSGGRAQLGIGTGWYELEHDSLGYEFGTFTDRFEKLEEALVIITGMLRGERPSLDGRWYQVNDAINSPAPVGRIPIMIGGAGEKKTLRMVAQYADGSNLICARRDIPRKLEALAGHCAALGRDRSEITVSFDSTACVAPTHEQAVAEAEAYLGQLGPAGDGIRQNVAIGTPDEIAEEFAALLAYGIDGFTVSLPANGHLEGRVAMLGEALAPVIAAAARSRPRGWLLPGSESGAPARTASTP